MEMFDQLKAPAVTTDDNVDDGDVNEEAFSPFEDISIYFFLLKTFGF